MNGQNQPNDFVHGTGTNVIDVEGGVGSIKINFK